MSYTSRATIQINESLLAHQPITFGYITWANAVEKTLFSQLVDVTNFNAVSVVIQATTGSRRIRIYFGDTKVAETDLVNTQDYHMFDISAYSGVYRVEIRVYGDSGSEAYPVTNSIPTLEVSFLTDYT